MAASTLVLTFPVPQEKYNPRRKKPATTGFHKQIEAGASFSTSTSINDFHSHL
jgi:hypothetical protein